MIKLDTLSLDRNTFRLIRESVCSDLIEHDYVPVIEPMEWITFFEYPIKSIKTHFIALTLVIPIALNVKQVIPLEVWQINDDAEYAAYLKLIEKSSKRGI